MSKYAKKNTAFCEEEGKKSHKKIYGIAVITTKRIINIVYL